MVYIVCPGQVLAAQVLLSSLFVVSILYLILCKYIQAPCWISSFLLYQRVCCTPSQVDCRDS
jgi:hypothetical protein